MHRRSVSFMQARRLRLTRVWAVTHLKHLLHIRNLVPPEATLNRRRSSNPVDIQVILLSNSSNQAAIQLNNQLDIRFNNRVAAIHNSRQDTLSNNRRNSSNSSNLNNNLADIRAATPRPLTLKRLATYLILRATHLSRHNNHNQAAGIQTWASRQAMTSHRQLGRRLLRSIQIGTRRSRLNPSSTHVNISVKFSRCTIGSHWAL